MAEECADRLQKLARRMVSTYQGAGGINRIGDTELPSLSRVDAVLSRLLTVVFPGYRGGRISARACMETFVASNLDAVFVELSAIIENTLSFCSREPVHAPRPLPAPRDGESVGDVAERVAIDYLDRLPDVRGLVKSDVEAAFEGDPAAMSRDEVILCYPGLLAVTVHRLAHPLYELGVPFVPRIMNEWAHARTGTDIHPGAAIGPSFFIDHATGVVIGETSEIGSRVKIYQGVTLGALSFRRAPDGSLVKGGKRHPTIEDDATIYANATILGGETVIGRGAVIGGGCWVTKSVPPGVTVMTHTHTDRS
ncbi:serine acetyltransferase [bacterium]|nr:serine acetyltransferase [bacterium]MBU1072313.1 serine acetyltransferase [bacterium]MBU1677227.1 serine acetyltransferase [bacterium]